jgi:tRNA U55 pseudouridine synthase TruB
LQKRHLEELKNESEPQLIELNMRVKDLTEKVRISKEMVKVERLRRTELEVKQDVLEEAKEELYARLAEIELEVVTSSKLQYTRAEFEKEKTTKLRLEMQLKEVREHFDQKRKLFELVSLKEKEIAAKKKI